MADDKVAIAEPTAETQEKPAAKPRAKKKAKEARAVPTGRVYVHASYNNTIVTLTDPQGNTLGWGSAGGMGFRGPRKATPYAATMVVRKVAEKVAPFGVREAHVFVRGIGGGRESAVRALHANGLQVLSIKDVTPIPHNGCRKPRPRKV